MKRLAQVLQLLLSLALPSAALATHESEIARAVAAPAGVSVVALRIGDLISERSYENDRIDWKLPAQRLERFRAAGVVIDEERHISSFSEGLVVAVGAGGPTLRVSARVTSYDVPRRQTTSTSAVFLVALSPDDQPRPGQPLSVAEAAMVGLPVGPKALRVGQRWRTHLAVQTSLGSGKATFDHEILGADNGLVEIAVQARGSITGQEYHLPKLLPGRIELSGAAWYDPRSGLVTQESYAIHNRLLKPAQGEQIGFDEHLTVDATTRLTSRSGRAGIK